MKYLYILTLLILVGCGKCYKGDKGDTGAQGVQGVAGLDAVVSAYSIASVIDPCGDAPGIIDEVLLKLHNGQILVSFSANANGDNTRFAILPAGSYRTTDGSNCNFTITATGEVL